MLPRLRFGKQVVVTGNKPQLDNVPSPTHNLASGIALAGTDEPNIKPKKLPYTVNAVNGTAVAGTTVDEVSVGTQPSKIRNRIPNIIPKFGSHKDKTTAWLVVLAAVGTMAGIYTAYQNRR